MLNAVKEMLASKKALATLTAILVWLLGRVGLDIPAETLLPVVSALMVYVLGQGWADKGKEAAKVAVAGARELSEDKGIGTSPGVADPQ